MQTVLESTAVSQQLFPGNSFQTFTRKPEREQFRPTRPLDEESMEVYAIYDEPEEARRLSKHKKAQHGTTRRSRNSLPSPVSVSEAPLVMSSSLLSTADQIQVLSVEPLFHVNEPETHHKTRKRKKVQFESRQPLTGPAATSSRRSTTRQEKAQVWYSRRELDAFRHDAKRQCRQAWKSNYSGFDQIYPSSFSLQAEAAQAAWECDPDLYRASERLARSKQFLQFRGLEHLSSQNLCLARSMTVLNVKTQFMLEQVQCKVLSDETDQDYTQHLADLYVAASHPAARFARMVALADATVAGHAD